MSEPITFDDENICPGCSYPYDECVCFDEDDSLRDHADWIINPDMGDQ